MKKAQLTFKKCTQGSLVYGSNDDYMVSRLFFTLKIDNMDSLDLFCDIKQVSGSNIEDTPIEIGKPENYKGYFNYDEFRKAAEKYYRSLIGSGGSGIRINKGAKNIRLNNFTVTKSMSFEFNVDEGTGGW